MDDLRNLKERNIDVHFPSHEYVPGIWAALGGFAIGAWTFLSLVFWMRTGHDGELANWSALGWKWPILPLLWAILLTLNLYISSAVSFVLAKILQVRRERVPTVSAMVYAFSLTLVAFLHLQMTHRHHQLLGKIGLALMIIGCLGRFVINRMQAEKIKNSWGQLKGTAYQSSKSTSGS